jgi:hypothetical protein
MVVRVTTTWSVIAALLLCPLACMRPAVATCAAQAAGQHQRVTDTCCAPAKCPDGDHDPGDRKPVQQGGNCLCHGALVADQSPASELQPVPVFWMLQELPTSSGARGSALDVAAEKHACHFASVDSGREVRALIESFLL